MHKSTALIAEDEPLLAAALRAELSRAWPDLQVVATVGDGASAVAQALALLPDVLFFDIRMPGMDGLDAAQTLAEEWPDNQAFPQLVFVTAYDQYAVRAFEAQAMDYLLKPVQTARLQKTVAKLQQTLRESADTGKRDAASAATALDQTLAQLRQLLTTSGSAAGQAGGLAQSPSALPSLRVIQASVGTAIHLVPVEDVVYFEAADKYVRVLTPTHEYLIRTPLRELLPQLDNQQFWQIHRATVVRAQAVAAVSRDEAGKLWIQLRGRPDRLPVSRLYAHLFKAM